MTQHTGNVFVVLVSTVVLVYGACSDSATPDPRTADQQTLDEQAAAQEMARCLPSACSVEAVRMADEYAGVCIETWREEREVRDAQRARGIPDVRP